MISDEHKIIFVHIPKNAGTSVKGVFSKEFERPFKHKTIHEIKKESPKKYSSYKKFAVVRNPYDRMVSWYAYQKRFRLNNDLIRTYEYNSTTHSYDVVSIEKADINGFRNWWGEQFDLFDKDRLLNPQYTWVDKTVTILKYENLNKELGDFLGKNIKLPNTNGTSRFDLLDYYDKRSIDIVYERYEEDFKKFDYKKL